MKKQLLTTLLLGAGLSTLMAGNARIDVSCKDHKKEIKQIKAQNADFHYKMDWRKQNPNSGHCFEKKTTNNWQEMAFTITPEENGEYIISLRGPWVINKETGKIKPVEIFFDDIKVEGAQLKNGSFENTDEETGQLRNWWTSKTFAKDKRIVTNKTFAIQGSKCIKVWHNDPAEQGIKVKKGVPVTIKAKVKSAK